MGKRSRRQRAPPQRSQPTSTGSTEAPFTGRHTQPTTADMLQMMQAINAMGNVPPGLSGPGAMPPMNGFGRPSEPSAENMSLLNRMSNENSLGVQQQLIRQLFVNIGIDVTMNDNDPFGDGDQSIKRAPQKFDENMMLNFEYDDVLHEIRMRGADIHQFMDAAQHDFFPSDHVSVAGMAQLGFSAARGNAAEVGRLIRLNSAPGSKERKEMLEKRVTSLRLTPLSMAALFSAHFDVSKEIADYVEVAKVLLKYGANPFARDIGGRTVIHHTTEPNCVSLVMANVCLQGSNYFHYFHQFVTLSGLSCAELNGSKGICGGFDTDSGRLVVYVSKSVNHEGEFVRPITVKPVNAQLANEGSSNHSNKKHRLVDCQERTGGTALKLIVDSGERRDIAEFLVNKHKANIDLTHYSDESGLYSPRQVATAVWNNHGGKPQPAHLVIKNRISNLKKKGSAAGEEKLCGGCKKQVGR